MRKSTKLADAMHILAYIHLMQGQKITSQSIATSLMTHPAFVRQIMSKLKNAGMITSVQGAAKPEIAKPLDQISLYDIYQIVEPNNRLIPLDAQANATCEIAPSIHTHLKHYYEQIQHQAEEEMKTITLAQLIDQVNADQQNRP